MNDICCIGHITLDKIVTPKQTTYMPGGTSYYFSHGIKHLKDKDNYKLVTALAPSEYKAVEEMRSAGIQVEVLPSRKTVYFENVYGENQDNRTQRVLAKADPFTVEELKNEEARILEKVFPVDWKDKREALKYIDILKVNEHEAEVLTGYKDAKQAALQLAEWGVKEVLLTLGSLGSLIYAEGVFHQIPAYPPKEVVDATGCGDTYAMGYLYMRNKGASYEEAGCFAAAMSTIKLEKSGPFSGTEEQVWNIIRNSNLHPQVI